MNHKLKRKWVNALRGGTYRQCFGKLHEGDAHCALAVLTQVQIEAGMLRDKSLPVVYGLAIMGMNDARMSFAEIADWIEEFV